MSSLGQSLERQQEIRWNTLEENIKRVSPTVEDIRVLGGQITIKELGSDMRFPLALVGGGHQEVIGLLHELNKGSQIFGLEEPEIHLHPQLARQFFENLKKLSKRSQIFITTHSTVFVDSAEVANTWVVRKEGKETVVRRIEEPKDLRGILFELGIRPSDIFFSNGIIFVEGLTEKVVLPILAEKIGIDFRKQDLSLIPTYGKSSGRYHLTTWVEAVKNANIHYFMILDKDAEREAKDLVDRGLLTPDENLFLLKKGSIEDYYPMERILEALSKIHIEVTESEKTELSQSPRDEKIEKFLREKNKHYKGRKVDLGYAVVESMTAAEIDDELKRIFERISTRIRIGPVT